jgi:hypothetical protein
MTSPATPPAAQEEFLDLARRYRQLLGSYRRMMADTSDPMRVASIHREVARIGNDVDQLRALAAETS